MKKSELTKLIESLGDDAEVDETISKSDLGKALASSGLTLDAFKEKVEKDADFKSFMDSEKDKHSTKSLETWKTNNLQKLINEAVAKANPQETPEQKKIRELEERIEKSDRESKQKDLTATVLKTMNEKKLSDFADLSDCFVKQDKDSSMQILDKLSEIISKHDESLTTNLLKNDTYKPGGQGGTEPTEEAVKGQINSLFGIKE